MTESSVRAELMPGGRTWQNYAFLGDVDEVCLSGDAAVRIADVLQLVVVELADTTTDDDVREVFLQTRSNFNLTGIVTASDTSSFNVEPSFHVPAFPVHCFPSFANKDRAATPSQGSLVTVEGFLDQVKRGARNAVTSVEVEVDQFRVFKPPRIGELIFCKPSHWYFFTLTGLSTVPDPGPRATCLFHHGKSINLLLQMITDHPQRTTSAYGGTWKAPIISGSLRRSTHPISPTSKRI